MEYGLIEKIEEKISHLSDSFIMDVENIISCYKEEIILLEEKIENEMNDIKNDSKSDDIANENPDYQELDGLYDSLDDIRKSIWKINCALEEIRNYI